MWHSGFPLHARSLAIIVALLGTGCASTTPIAGQDGVAAKPAYEAFVTQPQRLKPAVSAPDALAWEDAGVDVGRYDAVALEHIRVAIAGDATNTSIDPADLSMLTQYFQESIAKALGKDYPLVDKTGPGVLQLRVVIFDLVPTSVETSVVVFFTPYAMLPDLAAGAAGKGGAGASPYLGRTGIAVQFLDSPSGKIVAEYVETKFGKKYVVDTSQGLTGAVSTGIANYTKAFSAWDYARQAFDAWAQQLRARFDQSHGRAVNS